MKIKSMTANFGRLEHETLELHEGITLVIAIFVCCMNLLVDLAYAAIDPRIKAQFSGGSKRRKKTAKTQEVKA